MDDNGTGATDDDDMSDWSAPQSGMTDAVKPTTFPDDLLATPRGENRIWVSWTGLTGVTDYVLQWRRKGTSNWGTINVMGRTTHPHNTGLSAGMQYQYRIAAKNSGGTGPWSGEEDGTTWAKQLPTPTGLMAVDATDDATPQIKLTWKAVSGATGYEIQKWEVDDTAAGNAWRNLAGDDGVTMADEGMTSHTDAGTGVEPGMTYYYIVRATSGDVKSPWTGAMSGMTKAGKPALPTLDLAATGQTMVRLSWAANSADSTSKTGWNVQYAEGSVDEGQFGDAARSKMEMSLNAMPMHYIQRNLKPGTRYSFRVQGTLPLGVTSAWSIVEEVITRPGQPDVDGQLRNEQLRNEQHHQADVDYRDARRPRPRRRKRLWLCRLRDSETEDRQEHVGGGRRHQKYRWYHVHHRRRRRRHQPCRCQHAVLLPPPRIDGDSRSG